MNRDLIKFISGLLIFGTNGIVASHIGMTGFGIVLWKTLIGSIAVFAFFYLSGGRFELKKADRKDLGYLFISGLAMGLSWICLYEAFSLIGVATATLIYYCGPVIVIALAPLLLHEKNEPFAYLCFAVVLMGMLLINLRQFTAVSMDQKGLFLTALSAVMFAVMMIAGRSAKSITGLKKSALQIFFSFFAAACFILPKYGLPMPSSVSECFWLLVIGVVNTGLGCYLYFSTVGCLPIRTVSVAGYLEPVSAVLFSLIFLHEAFGPAEAAGTCMVLGGACALELKNCISRHIRLPRLPHASRAARTAVYHP